MRGMLDWLILSSVDEQAVLNELRKPRPAPTAPVPKRPLQLPPPWTVVTTATSYTNAFVGDMPLLPQGSISSDLVGQIKLMVQNPAWPFSSTIST